MREKEETRAAELPVIPMQQCYATFALERMLYAPTLCLCKSDVGSKKGIIVFFFFAE